MSTQSIGTPGQHAGPYDGRCSKCQSYLCDCPVAFMGHLGYLWCPPCSESVTEPRHLPLEPVMIRNLFDGLECCTSCGESVVPEYLR